MAKDSYHHGDLRNALIEIGGVVLAEDGAAALSLRKVARQAGVSHAAAYRHFADKEALIAAIAEAGFETLMQNIKRAMTGHPSDPLQQLIEAGELYVKFALENPPRLQVMFGEFDFEQHPHLLDASLQGFKRLVDLIRACQQHNVIIDGDARQLTLSYWSVMHGLAVLLMARKVPPALTDHYPVEVLVRQSLNQLMTGITQQAL